MATQQQPDPGRSYTTAPDRPRFARGLEPTPIDEDKLEWITASGQHGPRLPVKRKPAGAVHDFGHVPRGIPRKYSRSLKGLRGPRPALIADPVELRTCTDAGGVLRHQRRALGHTAAVVGPTVNVWPANLLDIERGKEIQLSTLIRIADGLGLRILIAPKQAGAE